MTPLRWLFRSGRAAAGLLLLATLVVGEVADTRHHLGDHGCTTDSQSPTRDDNCTCAGLHAAPLAGHAPIALAPVALESETAVVSTTGRTARPAGSNASPRAPPRS